MDKEGIRVFDPTPSVPPSMCPFSSFYQTEPPSHGLGKVLLSLTPQRLHLEEDFCFIICFTFLAFSQFLFFSFLLFFFFLQRALYISRNGRWDMFQRNIIQGLPFFSLQEIQHTLNFSCLIPLALPLKISLGDTLCVKSPLHLRFDFHSNKTIPEITLSPQISHWIFGKIII